MARVLLQNDRMRAIRGWALVSVFLMAAACSSTSSKDDAGQGGSGNNGQGGGAQGGSQGSGGSAGGGGQGGTGQGGTGGHAIDAGPDGTTGATGCNPACGADSVCVGTGTEGGAIFFPDGGVCPTGRHLSGNFCVQDLTFACMPIPSGCNGTATCACAPSVCNGRVCRVPTAGELDCVLQVPFPSRASSPGCE